MTTKIHAVVDALGNPIRLKITGGQVHDIVPAAELIEGIAADHVGADKAYDAQNFIDFILKQGATPVIPPKKTGACSGNTTGISTKSDTWWSASSVKSKNSGVSLRVMRNWPEPF